MLGRRRGRAGGKSPDVFHPSSIFLPCLLAVGEPVVLGRSHILLPRPVGGYRAILLGFHFCQLHPVIAELIFVSVAWSLSSVSRATVVRQRALSDRQDVSVDVIASSKAICSVGLRFCGRILCSISTYYRRLMSFTHWSHGGHQVCLVLDWDS